MKKYLEDISHEPLEESQDLFDEYPQIKEDLLVFMKFISVLNIDKALEKEGYVRKFPVKDKKGNKSNRVVMFGRNPADPIEQMNLPEEFKEFKDLKPVRKLLEQRCFLLLLYARMLIVIGEKFWKGTGESKRPKRRIYSTSREEKKSNQNDKNLNKTPGYKRFN